MHAPSFFRRLAALPCLTTLAALPALSEIITSTVDSGSGGLTGQHSSQAVVNGTPAIAYYNATDGKLMFARNSAAAGTGTWVVSVVESVDSPRTLGIDPSLAVIDGNPAISYTDYSGGALKFARNSNASGTGTWTVTTLDGNGLVSHYTHHSSLAVVNGNPAISFLDDFNYDLKFIRAADASGTSWNPPVTLVSTGNAGQFSSLSVLVGVGTPAISYYDGTNGDLTFLRALDADGAAWAAPVTVDAAGNVGEYTSFVCLFDTKPAISYYDRTNGNLKFARNGAADGSGAWTFSTVDGTGDVPRGFPGAWRPPRAEPRA